MCRRIEIMYDDGLLDAINKEEMYAILKKVDKAAFNKYVYKLSEKELDLKPTKELRAIAKSHKIYRWSRAPRSILLREIKDAQERHDKSDTGAKEHHVPRSNASGREHGDVVDGSDG